MRAFIFLLLFSSSALGIADGVLCSQDEPCKAKGLFTQKSAGPTKSDAIRVNPAKVPVESVTGVEAIDYKGAFDIALVKGLGRIGAAASPSNNDETFFGPPAPETNSDYFARIQSRSKYDAGKYTLAGAINLYGKDGEGFNHVNLNLGLMGRYISATHDVKPGVGAQLIWGPLYVGGSYLQDESQVNSNSSTPPFAPAVATLENTVSTFSGGLSLNSVMLDYSTLNVSGDSPSKTTVLTAAVFVSRFILTAAYRNVVSDKPAFDFSTNQLNFVQSKSDVFGGVQVQVASFLVLGAFYNYYLLHEVSAGATVFF